MWLWCESLHMFVLCAGEGIRNGRFQLEADDNPMRRKDQSYTLFVFVKKFPNGGKYLEMLLNWKYV